MTIPHFLSKIYLYFAVVIVIPFFCACEDSDFIPPRDCPKVVTLSKTSLTFEVQGGEQVVTVSPSSFTLSPSFGFFDSNSSGDQILTDEIKTKNIWVKKVSGTHQINIVVYPTYKEDNKDFTIEVIAEGYCSASFDIKIKE
ncbi:hypothetical protein [Myroides sp. LoEW2-1]|uniref:hypothetical protein n=1 Tax=Myroides sp. LoEW2-1 TaxID=2683192 RepID=UPI00132A658D|nr:hypothetical protein [Myroides sp. LoEW2-1]MVX35474.1 hypothetical protein [Myroides sp. LoEW2-1]